MVAEAVNARRWIRAGDLPDVSNVFRGQKNLNAGKTLASLHGVVFDVLVWEGSVAAMPTFRGIG